MFLLYIMYIFIDVFVHFVYIFKHCFSGTPNIFCLFFIFFIVLFLFFCLFLLFSATILPLSRYYYTYYYIHICVILTNSFMQYLCIFYVYLCNISYILVYVWYFFVNSYAEMMYNDVYFL